MEAVLVESRKQRQWIVEQAWLSPTGQLQFFWATVRSPSLEEALAESQRATLQEVVYWQPNAVPYGRAKAVLAA